MQPDVSVRREIANINSELSFVRGLLSDLEDTIKSVEHELASIFQTTQNLSTPSDTPCLKLIKKNSNGATSTSGEKIQKDTRLLPDHAQIVRGLSNDLESIKSRIASLHSLITEPRGSATN